MVSLWGDEDSYEVAVHKLLVRDGEVQVESAFTSKRLLNPHYDADLPLYCVPGKALYFLYRYQDASTHKKAQLVFAEGDPTRELYLKPIGLVAEKEWAECGGG